jgi:transcriptional regulator with XRE-family HTH domain
VAMGDLVRARRDELGLTQKQAGDRAGMTRCYWSMVENGWRTPDKLSRLEAIAAALEWGLDDLLGRRG